MAVLSDQPPHRRRRRLRHRVAMSFANAFLVIGCAAAALGIAQFWDVGANSYVARLKGEGTQYQRAALPVDRDRFGDHVERIEYLDQGWSPADSLWFYFVTQGSDLLPYDFFMVLEQKGTQALFRSSQNMNAYRYLPQSPSLSNPDGLAVGFVKDVYQGKEYIGLTRAACHTGQLNYNGVGYRIDGGPSGADMRLFIEDLGAAMQATVDTPEVRARFVKNVLARRTYANEAEVIADLNRHTQRLTEYATVNGSDTPYGYFRLDAFGRIYNRVLQHLLNGRAFVGVLNQMVADRQMTADQRDRVCACTERDLPNVMSETDRDDIVSRIRKELSPGAQQILRGKLYNRADAPVSYPFLWDVPHHDYVQWNGLAANAALGPVGRNTGEAIGVFGTLDWSEKVGFSISSLVSGQGLRGNHISFKSSVDVRNLRRIERHLVSLESPQWPKAFPTPDPARVERGRRLFATYCVSCHAEIVRDDPTRCIVAHMSRLSDIGTDSKMALNGINYSGLSGIVRNQYVNAEGVGDILIDEGAPVAELLTKVTLSTVATPDPDHNVFTRGFYWLYDLAASLFSNEIKASIKHGNYDPDTTADPYASLRAYKGRSLNGIWATAPYLHNGSVPSLYALLLPKREEGDPVDGEYRPDSFMVGSREFDPVEVGLKYKGYDGFRFDTSQTGNNNAGHEYGAKTTTASNGDPLPPLTKEERLDLVEYLKIL